MTDNGATGGGAAAGQAVVIALGEPSGVWVDPDGEPGERVVELLAHDGRITTIVQRRDGELVVRTDGLAEVSHAVRVAPDGSADPVPYSSL